MTKVTPQDHTELAYAIQTEAQSSAAAQRLVEALYPLYDSVLTHAPDGPILASHMRCAEHALQAVLTAVEHRRRVLKRMLQHPQLFSDEDRAYQHFMVEFEEARAKTWASLLPRDPRTFRLWLLHADPTAAEARDVWRGLGEVIRCWRQLNADTASYQRWISGARDAVGPDAMMSQADQALTLDEAYAAMSEAGLRAVRAFVDARRSFHAFKRHLNDIGDSPTCGQMAKVLRRGNTALQFIAEGYGALCWGSEVQSYVADFPAQHGNKLMDLNESATRTHVQLVTIAGNGCRLEDRLEESGARPMSEQDSREVLALLLHIADMDRRSREDRRRFQQLADPQGE